MQYWTLSQLRSFCFFNSKHKYTKKPLKHLQGKEARRQISQFKIVLVGFPGGAVLENPPAKAGDRVQALVREDPTCCGASKPVSHNYWAHVPHLLKPVHSTARAPQREATAMRSPRTATKSSPPLAATRESLRTATAFTATQHIQHGQK